MKKLLNDEIINDILDINIYKDKKDSYIIKLGNNVLLYFIANIILRILKMNLFIANFTIPVLTIKYIGECTSTPVWRFINRFFTETYKNI